MSLAAVLAPSEAPVASSEVGTISIDAVHVGPSMRAAGIDPLHVAALAEVAPDWPPILLNRADSSVIDGHHRVAAARQLRLRELRASWFEGSPDEAYIEFVRRNVGHGLPLTLAERRQAARQMLRGHAERSDRAIASVCGVSPTTIARLRKELDPVAWPTESTRARGRVGLDGRVRPLNGMELRARIAEEIELRPDASLRAIAGTVGASPETVRSVRNELRAGTCRAKYEPAAEADVAMQTLADSSTATALAPPREDPAFTDRDGGRDFVDWLDATAVEKLDPWLHVEAVPLSRVYEIADLARQRAEFWTRFAKALETRVRRWA